MLTNEERLGRYLRRGNTVASVDEAVWVIENAQELGLWDTDVDDAYEYIRNHRAQALVPAWIARGASDLDRAGDFD